MASDDNILVVPSPTGGTYRDQSAMALMFGSKKGAGVLVSQAPPAHSVPFGSNVAHRTVAALRRPIRG